MERTLDFSDVIRYDLSMTGSDMILELTQTNITTKIKIVVNKIDDILKVPNISTVNTKRLGHAKMTAEKVKEIRSVWDQTVKACCTKNAAAEKLAKIYGCSAKNIYAIIYRYSWTSV